MILLLDLVEVSSLGCTFCYAINFYQSSHIIAIRVILLRLLAKKGHNLCIFVVVGQKTIGQKGITSTHIFNTLFTSEIHKCEHIHLLRPKPFTSPSLAFFSAELSLKDMTEKK